MPNEIAWTRTFGGRKYEWATNTDSKAEANRKAKMIREGGHSARVVKNPQPKKGRRNWRYGVYARYK